MIQIRKATPKDADAVQAMVEALCAEEGIPPFLLDSDRFRRDGFGFDPKFLAWIAENEERKPVGHIIAYRGYDVQHACATVIVADLYVAPDYRRHGAARALAATVAREARLIGARIMLIWTGADGPGAKRFYEAVGAHAQTHAMFVLEPDELDWLAAEAE